MWGPPCWGVVDTCGWRGRVGRSPWHGAGQLLRRSVGCRERSESQEEKSNAGAVRDVAPWYNTCLACVTPWVQQIDEDVSDTSDDVTSCCDSGDLGVECQMQYCWFILSPGQPCEAWVSTLPSPRSSGSWFPLPCCPAALDSWFPLRPRNLPHSSHGLPLRPFQKVHVALLSCTGGWEMSLNPGSQAATEARVERVERVERVLGHWSVSAASVFASGTRQELPGNAAGRAHACACTRIVRRVWPRSTEAGDSGCESHKASPAPAVAVHGWRHPSRHRLSPGFCSPEPSPQG